MRYVTHRADLLADVTISIGYRDNEYDVDAIVGEILRDARPRPHQRPRPRRLPGTHRAPPTLSGECAPLTPAGDAP